MKTWSGEGNKILGRRSGGRETHELFETEGSLNKPLHKSYQASQLAIFKNWKRVAAVYFRVDEGGPHAGL
jgi:hypothetical protein